MIKPEEKRPDEKMEVALPAAYMDRVRTHAKDLSDSSPGYVVRAIVMDYFDRGRDQAAEDQEKPPSVRPSRRSATNKKAVRSTPNKPKTAELKAVSLA